MSDDIKYPDSNKIASDIRALNLKQEDINMIKDVANELDILFESAGYMYLNFVKYDSVKEWYDEVIRTDEGNVEKAYKVKYLYQSRSGDEAAVYVTQDI